MVCHRYLVQAGEEDKGLAAKPLGAFVRAVGGRSAAPGGGSVAAAAAALVRALPTGGSLPEGVPPCPPGHFSRHLGGLLGEESWCSGSGRGCALLENSALCPHREQPWAAWWG